MNQSAQVIVTGFHRSGTSMAMQALHKAGLYIGDALIGASSSNPDGHFEDVETVKLHDSWLNDAGVDWCCTRSPHSQQLRAKQLHANTTGQTDADADADAEKVAAIRAIAQRLGESEPLWGIKDPRASLYLSEWFDALANPYGVLVYRHYASCVTSIQRRQADVLLANPTTEESDIRFWVDPGNALQSWLVHNQALIKHLRQFPDRCVLVSQEAQIAGTDLSAIVSGQLSLKLQNTNDTGVDSAKTTTQATIQMAICEWQNVLETTWNELQTLAHAPAGQFPHVEWHPETPEQDLSGDNSNSSDELHRAMKRLHRHWDSLGISPA